MILSYSDFLQEAEKVNLKKPLREYTLTHVGNDRFQLKSDDFYKEFSVLPYRGETIESLKKVHESLLKSIESLNVEDLYSAVEKAQKVSYPYGNVYTSEFSLSSIAELGVELDPEQQKLLSSPREFLMNVFSQLNKTSKDDIIEALRERAEVLCAVIEALFYYIRTIDKDNFYNGMSSEEILEEYENQIKKSSSEESFSYEGPFSSTDKTPISADSRTAFWTCEKNMKAFFIQATILPKELYAEENVSGTKGLKFSLITEADKNPQSDFSFFEISELSNRIKLFYDKILKNEK